MGNTLAAAHCNLTGASANSRAELRLAGTSEDPQVQLLACTGQLQQVVQDHIQPGPEHLHRGTLSISKDGEMEGEGWGTT